MLTSKIKQGKDIIPRPFPKLMKHKTSPLIVLIMNQSGCGTVVNTVDEGHWVGKYSSNWTVENFEDFIGIIELKQE